MPFSAATPGLSALAASPAGAASNPPLSCAAPTIYNVNSSGNLYSLDYSNRVNSAATPSNVGNGAVNALGLSSDGTTVYSANMTVSGSPATTTVSVENVTTASNTNYSGMPATGLSEIIAGGVNPVNGYYYYGGWNSAETEFILFAFNPTTHSGAEVGTITPPTGASYDYGDLTFDGSGNLTVLAGTTSNTAKLLTVSAPVPTSGTSALSYNPLATITATKTEQYVGIAFAADSTLYVETIQGELYSVNPNTGTITDLGSQSGMSGTPTDLASCSYNGSMTVEKNIVGRVASGDQFTMTITGGGVSSGNTGTTTGSSTGLQTGAGEVAGPIVGIPGTTYTATETAGGHHQPVQLPDHMVVPQRLHVVLEWKRDVVQRRLPVDNDEYRRGHFLYLHQHPGVPLGDQDAHPHHRQCGGADGELRVRRQEHGTVPAHQCESQ